MSNASYHAETDSISCSQLKLFIKSPAEYYATFVTKELEPKESNSAMDIGTVIHAILLEKKPIDSVVRAYPSSCLNVNGGLIGKNAKEFSEKIHPIIPMKDDQIEQVEKICASALRSQLGPVLQSGAKFEQRIDAEIEGVKCRCKPDIHTKIDNIAYVWDLKATERIHPSEFWRTAGQLGYSTQDAMYSMIAEKHYGCPSVFRFWAIETVKLFRVEPRDYDQRSREIAKDFVKKKLNEFAQRRESGNWDDAWETTGSVNVWDFGGSDSDELVDFEG